MSETPKMVRLGLLGAGGIMRGCHVPGFQRIPGVEIVAVADPAPGAAERLAASAGIPHALTTAEALLERNDLDAIVIATPNDEHPRLVRAAVGRGLHVLCEKPLALNVETAESIANVAEQAGVVHMTAFTYRFVPSMRWLAHRVAAGEIGAIHHFRSQRFQDFGDRALGWRQEKARAGTGEIGDMMAHRIDYSHMLLGPAAGLFGKLLNLFPERRKKDTGEIQASDVDDWAALLVKFESGGTGVFESSKAVAGYGSGLKSRDMVEMNGAEGSFRYLLHEPTTLWHASKGEKYEPQPVPEAFLKLTGSPRDPADGDPSETFRYDQAWEFISAIREGRPASPSLHDGVYAQRVITAALRSDAEGRWVEFADTTNMR